MNHITTEQAAVKAGVCKQRILALLAQHRIPGATKHSGVWLIPADFVVVPPPVRAGRAMRNMPARPTSR